MQTLDELLNSIPRAQVDFIKVTKDDLKAAISKHIKESQVDFLVKLANKEYKIANKSQDICLKELHEDNLRAIQRVLRILKEPVK